MFRNLFFVQGDEAHAFLAQLDARGAPDFLTYLADVGAFNWDGALYDEVCAGTRDSVEQSGRFHVTHNAALSYVGVDYWQFSDEVE